MAKPMLPRAMDLWLPAYLGRSRAAPGADMHVLLAICDHFEPFHDADRETALARVTRWGEVLPRFAERFRGVDGVGVRHTFFYPIEQYDREVFSGLEAVCSRSGAEVEVHLHHEDDTEEGLRAALVEGVTRMRRHGFLGSDGNGDPRFGFIHGNWALDDSAPGGGRCGVREELRVLAECGCYADFTMPSAPDRCQTRTINSLYYATDTPAPKSHDTGTPARAGRPGSGDLLLVQGPLGLNWSRRKWGIIPRIENGDLTGANPPTPDRFRLWVDLNVHVAGRSEWRFIKLHTHGAIPRNADMLLGSPMEVFHEWLAGQSIPVHYVTAREMVNILHAAEQGRPGDPSGYRDFVYQPPECQRL